ncbi:MAG: MFS transporter [Hyphomicrobiales bacterium]|nr:MFS transporter [Hyphomicrobiales bacterium]
MPAVLALFLGYVMSMFYRSFLAIVAQDLGRDLGFGAAELSSLSSAWLFTFALSQIPLGPALDRFGVGRTVAACSFLTVVGATLFAVSQNFTVSLIAMAAIGAGCAANLMGATVHVALKFPPQRFAWMLAILISAGSLGQLLGATPLALASEAFGWRPTMLATAFLSFVSALAVLLTVRDKTTPARREGAGAGILTGALRIARLPALRWMLPVIFTSYAVVISERSLWIGPYLAEVHGLDPVSIGNAALAMSVLMACGALAFGPAERILHGPKMPALGASIIVGLTFVVLGTWQGIDALRAIALLGIIGFFGLSYGSLMAHARLFIPDTLIGVGATFINFVFMSGAGLVQFLSGVFVARAEAAGVDASHRYAFLHMGFGVLLLATAAVYVRAPRRPMGEADALPAQ